MGNPGNRTHKVEVQTRGGLLFLGALPLEVDWHKRGGASDVGVGLGVGRNVGLLQRLPRQRRRTGNRGGMWVGLGFGTEFGLVLGEPV